jgi:tetratricopeptide (TPR) repeat protein
MVHLLNSIAYAMESMGDYPGAVEHLEAALKKLCKLAETNESLADDCLANTYYIACVCEQAGEFEKALEYYNRLIEAFKARNVRYYPSCLNNIANVMTELGQIEQSIEPRIKAIDQIKEFIGPKSISCAQSMKNLSVIYQSLCDYRSAKEFLLPAIEIKRKILGANSKECIRDVMFLIELYTQAGQPDKAFEIFLRLLDEIGAELSSRDEMIRELADLYMNFGDINRLNELYNKAMERHNDNSQEDG